MSDVLAGMTRKEAEALARSITGVTCTYSGPHPAGGRDALDSVRALAALGAKVLGAKMGEATCVSAEGYEDSGVVDVRTAVVGPVALGATVLVLEADHD